MSLPVVEPDDFKAALSAVCTPVAVVATLHEGRPHGTTVSAFCSLSLSPPLILVSLDRGSDLLSLLGQTGRFAVNVLSHDQTELAARFAHKGAAKFDGVDHEVIAGLPRIDGISVWLQCRLTEEVDGGDHVIAIGHVEHAHTVVSEPLLYRHRTFRALARLAEGH